MDRNELSARLKTIILDYHPDGSYDRLLNEVLMKFRGNATIVVSLVRVKLIFDKLVICLQNNVKSGSCAN